MMKKLKIFLTIMLLSLIMMAMKAQSNGSVEVKALTSTKEVALKRVVKPLIMVYVISLAEKQHLVRLMIRTN